MNDDDYPAPEGRPMSKEEIVLNRISAKTIELVYKDNRIPVGQIIGRLSK